jgi:hypothetical protein
MIALAATRSTAALQQVGRRVAQAVDHHVLQYSQLASLSERWRGDGGNAAVASPMSLSVNTSAWDLARGVGGIILSSSPSPS